MKILKEFIPLIETKEKQYEFRNANNKTGFYKIGKKVYLLSLVYDNIKNFIIKPLGAYSGLLLEFEDGSSQTLEITKQESQWISLNPKYFLDLDGNQSMFVYRWTEVPNAKDIKVSAIKTLEVIK